MQQWDLAIFLHVKIIGDKEMSYCVINAVDFKNLEKKSEKFLFVGFLSVFIFISSVWTFLGIPLRLKLSLLNFTGLFHLKM